jgi:hydrogenase small subunit
MPDDQLQPDAPPFNEITILWITAGLGCDGDTIAMTAATQPSLEDILQGGIPWTPKVHFHNPFLAYENGDDFMRPFHEAAEGKLSPFILVIEGSIPNEKNKPEGYWATFGTDPKTSEPIPRGGWPTLGFSRSRFRYYGLENRRTGSGADAGQAFA